MDVENWIKSNLKKGISPEYLKQELKKNNYPPELVDKIQEELLKEKIKEVSHSHKNIFQKKILILIFLFAIFISIYYFNTTTNFQEIKKSSLEYLNNLSKEIRHHNEVMLRNSPKESDYWGIEENCTKNPKFNSNVSAIKDCIKNKAINFLPSYFFVKYMSHTFDSLLIVINQTKEEINKQESFKTCDEKSEYYSKLLNLMLCIGELSTGYAEFNSYMKKYNPQEERNKLAENNYSNYTEKEILEYIYKETSFSYNNLIDKMCNYIIEEYPKVNENIFLDFDKLLQQQKGFIGNNKLNINIDCLEELRDKTKKLNKEFISRRYNVLKDNCNNHNYDKSISDIILLLGYIRSKGKLSEIN